MRKTVFKLPDETFLEILSYFPRISFRYKVTDGLRGVWGLTVLPAEYVERLDVLRAITQTCRTLRQKFLSWLWERVEACVVPDASAWYIYVGNTLERNYHILFKNPPLATHVRSAMVTSFILLYLTLYRRQRNVCYRHSLPDGYDSPRLRRLCPILAKPPHFGTMPRSSIYDHEAQEGIRGKNDAHYPNCCSAHGRPSHFAVMPER